MKITLQERMESLKAGGIAGMAFLIVYGLFILVNHNFGIPFQETLVKLAIALLSGFLFGVTYRYIIRTDSNSHLKEGSILAFGLVRGGGLAEMTDHLLDNGVFLAIVLLEGIIGFAIARLCLDIALSRQWLKPFS
jgi:drug/metabolite transporter (DMT)-like permease